MHWTQKKIHTINFYKSRVFALFLGFFALGVLSLTFPMGCHRRLGPRGTRNEHAQPVRGGILHVAKTTDVRFLDPAIAFDTESQPILELVFDGLVNYDHQGNLVGQLAERWEVSPEHLSYRFFLRRGVIMHDGNELLAEDIRRSLERTLHADTPCPASSFYERIKGFTEYQAKKTEHISGLVVESSHVFRIDLSKPEPALLQVLALSFARPVCRSAGTQYNDSFQKNICGVGPFELESWDHGRSVKLRRFANYYNASSIYLEGVEFKLNVPRFTQRLALERGELDIVNEFDRSDVVYFRSHPEWSQLSFDYIEAAVYGEFMNVEMAPFHDKRIRQAVAAAIHRPHLSKYFEGTSVVTGTYLPPSIAGHDPKYQGQMYDYPRALKLMADAGYAYDPKTGRGGYPTPIQYIAVETESSIRLAQIVQYDLAQIGLKLEIKIVSYPHYLALCSRPKTAQMGYAGWSLDYPDPSDFFEPVFSSKAITPEASQNYAYYRNPYFDDLLERAHNETNHEKRLSMYREAERIIVEDAPWAFTYFPMRYEIAQPYVHNYKPHRVWQLFLRHVWLDSTRKNMSFTSLTQAIANTVSIVLPVAMRSHNRQQRL